MKVSQDRLGYVGHQTRNVSSSFYDIRFVSVIDSLSYDSIGYDIVVTADGEEKADITHYCTEVYDRILELDYDRTSAQLGGKYIFAVGINGFDITAGEVVFEVTPYYYLNGSKVPLTTVNVTYTDGVLTSSAYVYN